MPISSVSRVYDAPDPILETDLELLAKVNTYQQSKFDAASAALQQEVNNWAMMANIAKPELKEYANQKLNNLVNGINNLGGVNLSDINNVNSLKALGYNIKGDQRIIDGVVTTQKMRALQTASQTKLSGKDGAKYDSTVADYLMKGYSDWASDGNVDNTRYDGPTDLPVGNMNTVNEKVKNYFKELKPDSDSKPSGLELQQYGYFQVEGKWLKGNRLQEAIQAVTDENDSLIFRAHGWKALAGDNDTSLIGKLGVVYDNTSSSIKNHINEVLQPMLNQTKNASEKIEIEKQIAEQIAALATNEAEKNQWFNKSSLAQGEREGIQESLYKQAWQSNVVNSYSYNQEKKELKTNMPLIFSDRMAIQAKQFAQSHDLAVKKYDLDVRKQLADEQKTKGLPGFPGAVPRLQEPNTNETNQQATPSTFIDNINADYFNLNKQYYDNLYNNMGASDSKERFEKVGDLWKPKPQYREQIDKEVSLLSNTIDNYAKATDEERKALSAILPEDRMQQLTSMRSKIASQGAFQKIARDAESQIINSAIAGNVISKDWRPVPVEIEGFGVKTMEEVLALNKAGIIPDDAKTLGKPAEFSQVSSLMPGARGLEGYSTPRHLSLDKITPDANKIRPGVSVLELKEEVEGYRDKAKTYYQKGVGKIFNSYNVPLPMENLSKLDKEIIQKQLKSGLPTLPANVDIASINPINGKIQMDFVSGTPRYMMNIQSGSTDKTRITKDYDITDLLKKDNGEGVRRFYGVDDVTLNWGLALDKNGATPFNRNNDYKESMRTTNGHYPFQISSIKDNVNGVDGFVVKIALPIGDGKTVEVDVRNLISNTSSFPANIKAVENYLNAELSTPANKKRFYEAHGVSYK